ncbi:hypothetical protein K456DRAFT_1210478 [Colletotrichum gloeosporioides 23]|nr:hypothetical protein K456DRAFT_1210478 [Colletotrichum gloeosporioides 23]
MASPITVSDSSSQSQRNRKRQAQSPSSSNQPRPEKRQRQHRELRHPSPTLSTSSSGSSISPYYGAGDDRALDNIFASHPQSFTSVPEPHGLRGHDDAAIETYNNHKIWLSLQYPSGLRWQKVKMPMLGPEYGRLPSHQWSRPQPTTEQREPTPEPTPTEFTSALNIIRKVIGKERALTEKAARACERVRRYRERMVSSTLLASPLSSAFGQSRTFNHTTLFIRKVLLTIPNYNSKPTDSRRPRTLNGCPFRSS